MRKYIGFVTNIDNSTVEDGLFGEDPRIYVESSDITIHIPKGLTINTGKPVLITQEED